MNKKSLCIVFLMLFGLVLVGCGNSGTKNNPDTPLLLSTQELDGVFNPFYSSSAADSGIISMTQISMLGNDVEGKVAYGEDEAVVVLDYETRYDQNEDTTTYYFVLKNNVKFSDGSALTIKDVLFNLYVYLDPVYTGSSTIYSTDIVGLQEYRTQQADEEEQERFMEQFQIEATTRIESLVTAAEEIFDDNKNETFTIDEFRNLLSEYVDDDVNANLINDYNKVCELFKEELETDYKNASGEAYKDVSFKDNNGATYKDLLTTDVEMFLYNEGYLSWNKNDARLESSLTNNVKELKNWSKEQAINVIYNDKLPGSLEEVVLYWNTSVELNDYLVNAALEQYNKENERVYKNISGIKFINQNEEVTVNNKTYAVPQYDDNGNMINDTNEVLSITINKVDPKAIWNFAFTVAPMYYYSDEAHIAAFDFESNFGVEYASESFMTNVIKNPDKIGVPVGAGPYIACDSSHSTTNVKSGDFRSNNVLYFTRNENYLMGVPSIKYIHYQVVASSGLLNAIYNDEIHFVQPNAKPETIEELKTKKDDGIQYKTISTSGYGYIGVNAAKVPSLKVRQAIMHSIDTQETVSYYGTAAIAIHRSISYNSWAYPKGCTPYYPYIGGAIPEDLSVVNPDYADFVKEKGKKAGEKFTLEEQKEFLTSLVEDAGYVVGGDGVYVKGDSKLKYTFTIAGSDQDHPAFNAFLHASELLNQINFEITVSTDAQALSKLASGGLAVWAAAWTSPVDPDMYQVYHMDSKASSTKNWGYDKITLNTGGKYDEEYELLVKLSDLIDQGRETTDQNARAKIYSKALDMVMQLAIELPTYQRDDLFAYNIKVIDESSLPGDANLSPYTGLLTDIHKVRLNTTK